MLEVSSIDLCTNAFFRNKLAGSCTSARVYSSHLSCSLHSSARKVLQKPFSFSLYEEYSLIKSGFERVLPFIQNNNTASRGLQQRCEPLQLNTVFFTVLHVGFHVNKKMFYSQLVVLIEFIRIFLRVAHITILLVNFRNNRVADAFDFLELFFVLFFLTVLIII